MYALYVFLFTLCSYDSFNFNFNFIVKGKLVLRHFSLRFEVSRLWE